MDNSIKKIGVLCKVIGKMNQLFLYNNKSFPSVLIQMDVLFRVRILDDLKNIPKNDEFFQANVELIEDEISIIKFSKKYFFINLVPQEIKQKIIQENLYEKLKSEANKYFLLNRYKVEVRDLQYNYVKFVFIIIPYLKLTGSEKQNLLEINDLYQRMKSVLNHVLNLNKLILLKHPPELTGRKNSILKLPQLDTVKKPDDFFFPTKHDDSSSNTIQEFEDKIKSIKLPEEAKKIALDELKKLKSSKNNPENEWAINYLNTLLSLPWDKHTIDSEDIHKAKEHLDKDHYGLEKVKKRIIEYLSVKKLNKIENTKEKIPKKKEGSILCFNGPPGVGKTSLAKSIANALGKKFYRLSLGGLREVSEINGHRRTFIAAMPGMIIQALRRIQSKNPVILLDEIDKVGTANFKGDVSSALLEILDPDQNHSFKDHYINTPFDLSQVFFICTSNYMENISPPLRDRLEIIEISGYTVQEKIEIGKKYLIPKQLNLNGLISDNVEVCVEFSDRDVSDIILNYTYESGVRQLDRSIAGICRYIARITVEEIERRLEKSEIKGKLEIEGEKVKEDEKISLENAKYSKTVKLTEKMIEEILGRKRKEIDLDLRLTSPGVAIVNNFYNEIIFRD